MLRRQERTAIRAVDMRKAEGATPGDRLYYGQEQVRTMGGLGGAAVMIDEGGSGVQEEEMEVGQQ